MKVRTFLRILFAAVCIGLTVYLTKGSNVHDALAVGVGVVLGAASAVSIINIFLEVW